MKLKAKEPIKKGQAIIASPDLIGIYTYLSVCDSKRHEWIGYAKKDLKRGHVISKKSIQWRGSDI